MRFEDPERLTLLPPTRSKVLLARFSSEERTACCNISR
jgi:hypothetical protein